MADYTNFSGDESADTLASDSQHGATDESAHADAEAESKRRSDEELLSKAKACFTLAEEAEESIRRLATEDLEFRAGKQWPESVQREREADGRPCLVVNRIPQFIQQVTNDQRQNRPAIKVHAVDEKATKDTADIIQGLIRHIEYNSDAESAYDTGFESAAGGGFGFWRVITEYASPTSFDQEIFIKRVRDQMSVYLDPHAEEADGSDAAWGFVFSNIPKDEFQREYPDSELSQDSDWEALSNLAPGWIKRDSVRVAEYFYKSHRKATICQLSNGDVVEKDKLQDYAEKAFQQAQGAPLDIRIVAERETTLPAIKWCKLNGAEVLEQTDWPGLYIPIVPVYGTDLFINGERILEGVIRHAKDPQRMLNYWRSAQTEAIALAPRAPFVGAEGQFEGHEGEWSTANKRNHAYLEFKPVSLNGQPMPAPQRQAFEPAVQAITQAAMMAADDMKATTGIYDPSLGAQSNETSGIAIQRRNVQAQTSNFHFTDNLTRAIRYTGRILVDLIPRIYDTARAARIIGDDGEQKIVRLNEPHVDESGKPVLYDLSTGRYGVTVDVGPSFASKRQEAVASMLDVSKSYPPIMQAAGDLFVKNMDWPGATEISERLKKMLPPNLIDDPKNKQAQVPPQVQMQLQQMSQMIDGLTKHLNEANHAIETKQLELTSRERIEMAKLNAEIEIQMAKMGSQESMALLKHEMQAISERLNMLGFNQPPQDFSQIAAQPTGAPGADVSAEMHAEPTGGQTPGSPMDGQFQ